MADVATSGDYNDLENKPDIPSDMEFYIKKDGTVGSEPSEGATGFKVSTNGLLQASNAIIYGEIVASSGKIGGFNISTIANNNDHAYKNTLYRIINGSDGYDYQAGIKGDSDSNTTIEAAFYVRKKLRSEKWGDSTIPFFVRNDGYVYCEDMTIGNSLYATGELSTKYDNLTSKFKIITAATDSVYFGLLNDTIKSRIACHTKGMLYEFGVDRPFSIVKDGNLTYSIKKQGGINVDLGASGVNYRYRNLYIEKIIFPDNSSMTTAKTSGDNATDTSGLKLNTIRIGSTGNGVGMGGGKEYNVYSDKAWGSTLPITCATIGAALSEHTHSEYVSTSGNSTSSPITGTLYMANNKGWDMLNTSGNPVTGIYCNPSNQVVVGDNQNAASTLIRGKTIQLGNTSGSIIFFPLKPDSGTKYLTINTKGELGTSSGGGSVTLKIGGSTTTSTDFSSYNLATQDWVNGKGYLTQHQSLYGYATQSWVTSNFAAKDSGGGGNNFSKSSIDTLYNQSSSSYSVSIRNNGTAKIFAPNSDSATRLGYTGYKWKTIHCQSSTIDTSDEHLKTNLHSIGSINHIEDVYMHLNPIVYQFKNFDSEDDHDRCHFGFGARETEKIFNDYNINASDYGILCKGQLDKPNKAGDMVEYAFRYGEFVSLNTFMTQKAHHRIDSLEEQNTSLKSENQSLRNEILMLQGQLSLINQRLQKLEENAC